MGRRPIQSGKKKISRSFTLDPQVIINIERGTRINQKRKEAQYIELLVKRDARNFPKQGEHTKKIRLSQMIDDHYQKIEDNEKEREQIKEDDETHYILIDRLKRQIKLIEGTLTAADAKEQQEERKEGQRLEPISEKEHSLIDDILTATPITSAKKKKRQQE